MNLDQEDIFPKFTLQKEVDLKTVDKCFSVSQPQNDSSDCNPIWSQCAFIQVISSHQEVAYPVLIKHPWSGLLRFDSDFNRTACWLQSASCAFLQKQYCSSVNSCWLNKNRQHPHFHSLLCSLNEKSCIIGLSCEILPFISECLEHFSASSRAKLGHSVTMCFSCNFWNNLGVCSPVWVSDGIGSYGTCRLL